MRILLLYCTFKSFEIRVITLLYYATTRGMFGGRSNLRAKFFNLTAHVFYPLLMPIYALKRGSRQTKALWSLSFKSKRETMKY